jgi:hypothetical protein
MRIATVKEIPWLPWLPDEHSISNQTFRIGVVALTPEVIWPKHRLRHARLRVTVESDGLAHFTTP